MSKTAIIVSTAILGDGLSDTDRQRVIAGFVQCAKEYFAKQENFIEFSVQAEKQVEFDRSAAQHG